VKLPDPNPDPDPKPDLSPNPNPNPMGIDLCIPNATDPPGTRS